MSVTLRLRFVQDVSVRERPNSRYYPAPIEVFLILAVGRFIWTVIIRCKLRLR